MISQRQLFLQHVAQTSPSPLALHIEKAEGCFLYDSDGKKYIDLISGISVCNLGHNHPLVKEAIKNQLDKYMHIMVYGELIESPQTQLAKLLDELLPPQLNCTYFVNSGAEAVEGAMKLAKRFTGRNEIIAFKNAYHGSTQGALSLMSDEYFTSAFRPLLPGIKFIDRQKPDLNLISPQTACVILELVKGEEGCKVLPQELVQSVAKRCRENGALLIIDECQTGIGRTGSLFAFEEYAIQPDVIILGKALGGGMPLGAFVSSKEIMSVLTHNPVLGHLTTFGGHPVSCAAAYASLKEIAESKIYLKAKEKEKLFRKMLQHEKILSISGKGLLLAVEFDTAQSCKKYIDAFVQEGVFTDWFLFAPQSMRIAPPLNITDDIIQHSCEIILNCLDKY